MLVYIILLSRIVTFFMRAANNCAAFLLNSLVYIFPSEVAIPPVKVFDIQSEQSGDVTKKFIDYSQHVNQASVKNVLKKTVWPMPAHDSGTISPYTNKMPENLVDSISQYPETTICTE